MNKILRLLRGINIGSTTATSVDWAIVILLPHPSTALIYSVTYYMHNPLDILNIYESVIFQEMVQLLGHHYASNTLYFHCIPILRFCNVEISWHNNLPFSYVPLVFIHHLVFIWWWNWISWFYPTCEIHRKLMHVKNMIYSTTMHNVC